MLREGEGWVRRGGSGGSWLCRFEEMRRQLDLEGRREGGERGIPRLESALKQDDGGSNGRL